MQILGGANKSREGASPRSASRADPTALSRAETTLFRTKIASGFLIFELVQVSTISLKVDVSWGVMQRPSLLYIQLSSSVEVTGS